MVSALTKRWKSPCIIHWDDFRNRIQPTDSAEEAKRDASARELLFEQREVEVADIETHKVAAGKPAQQFVRDTPEVGLPLHMPVGDSVDACGLAGNVDLRIYQQTEVLAAAVARDSQHPHFHNPVPLHREAGGLQIKNGDWLVSAQPPWQFRVHRSSQHRAADLLPVEPGLQIPAIHAHAAADAYLRQLTIPDRRAQRGQWQTQFLRNLF